jgi:hypothetical protein
VNDLDYAAIERRIEWFIAGLGGAITIGAAVGWGLRSAVGAAVGTALCWLNFRWLRQGAAGVIRLGLMQADAEEVRIPKEVHARFFGRLALLLLAAYAILALFRLPAVAVLCGLVAVAPAIMLELGYEFIHGHHRWNAE